MVQNYKWAFHWRNESKFKVTNIQLKIDPFLGIHSLRNQFRQTILFWPVATTLSWFFLSIFKRIEPQEWTPMWFDLPCLHYKNIIDMNLLLKALTVPFLHFLIFQRKKRHLQNAVISKLVMQWIYCKWRFLPSWFRNSHVFSCYDNVK